MEAAAYRAVCPGHGQHDAGGGERVCKIHGLADAGGEAAAGAVD